MMTRLRRARRPRNIYVPRSIRCSPIVELVEGAEYACLVDNGRGRVSRLTFSRALVIWTADILFLGAHQFLVFHDDSGSELSLRVHRVLWPWSEHRLITLAASHMDVAVFPTFGGRGRWWDLNAATLLTILTMVRPQSEYLSKVAQAASRNSVVRLGISEMVRLGDALDGAF